MLAMLSVYCSSWAFSSCRERGLLSSCDGQASHCGGFSHCGAGALEQSGLVVVVHRLNCPLAYGIFLDQRSNPRLLR